MRSESKRSAPSRKPTAGRSGPAAPGAEGVGGAAGGLNGLRPGGPLDKQAVLGLQKSLGNAEVAELLGERRKAEGSGERLDEQTRTEMEERFGRDFGDVTVHTDRDAGRAADRRGANAFTDGKDITFAEGKYDPGSPQGKALLAHELAHVAQRDEPSSMDRAFSSAHVKAEDEAARAADKATDKDGGPIEVKEKAPEDLVLADARVELANTQMSDEQSEVIAELKDAAGEKWDEFDEWWSKYKDSALASVEAVEEGQGEEFSQVTRQLELDLGDTFRETSLSVRRIAGQLREENPEGAKMLDGLNQFLESTPYLVTPKVQGMAKLIETIRLFFIFHRIEEAAEDLRRVDPLSQPGYVALKCDELFTALTSLGDYVPGGIVEYAEQLANVNQAGGFFRDSQGTSSVPLQEYRLLAEKFRALD